MNKRLKHLLPLFSVLEHCSLDEDTLTNMVQCITELKDDFKSVFSANKDLAALHGDLAKSVYENFFQINLTDSVYETNIDSLADSMNLHSVGIQNYRMKMRSVMEPTSPLNEATYTKKSDTYHPYSHILDKIISQFKGRTTRIRLVKLCAGTNISPHIDYDPSYSVRIIIPIISDNDCVNLFWYKNTVQTVSFEPGNAYFLNTGYKHAVVNLSKNDRYTLMISVDGTEDINHLITK